MHFRSFSPMKSFRWVMLPSSAVLALGLTLSRAQTVPETPAAPAPAAEAPAQPAAPEAPERFLSLDNPPPAQTPPADPAAAINAEPETAEERSAAGIVVFGSDGILAAGDRAKEVVAIIGNTIVDGTVDETVVAIMGDSTLNGEAREVVAVMGNVTINGRVRGDVVAVMGGVQLGPRARVDGEVVSIGGGV